MHFEEQFGARQHKKTCCAMDGVCMLAIDFLGARDLEHGRWVGRSRYPWIRQEFALWPARLGSSSLHHHLAAADSAGTPGRERKRRSTTRVTAHGGGQAASECRLVLSGHKHVPHAWRLEDLFVVNAGTV
jgi:hypothetical protein